MDTFNIYSVNINGLRGRDRQYYLKNFINTNKHVDILCIQETHVDSRLLSDNISSLVGHQAIWSYGSGRQCGVAVFVLNPNVKVVKYETDIDGRYIFVDFSYDNTSLRLFNIYAPNQELDRITFFNNIVPHLVTSYHLCICGDFNFVFDTSLDKIGGNLDKGTVGSKIFRTITNKFKLFDVYRFLYPSSKLCSWTRSFGLDNVISCRLDRFYISLLLKNSVVNSGHVPCSISDHDFVFTSLKTIGSISFGRSYWKFNNSLLDDTEFSENLSFYIKVLCKQDVTLDNWDGIKDKIKAYIGPCQIGILLSVRVRVGLGVLNPIKKQILSVKFSSIISMFRDSEKNITKLKLKR